MPKHRRGKCPTRNKEKNHIGRRNFKGNKYYKSDDSRGKNKYFTKTNMCNYDKNYKYTSKINQMHLARIDIREYFYDKL